MGDPIQFYNRRSGKLETEQIYGEGPLRFAYENLFGRGALHLFVKRPVFSRWYGWRMSSPASRARIAPFIQQYGLDPADFADAPDSYGSFNDFFSRRLKPEARPVDAAADSVIFPADGRHLGFQNAEEISGVFVKGQRWDLAALLGDGALAERFRGGPLVLSRLCPVDYHRFHFPAAGVPGRAELINGPLYSVSAIALRRRLAYLWENKRVLTRLETEKLGTVLLLEIGATNVGTIQQTYQPGAPVAKGAEKGTFRFGGSSTITIFEPGRVQLAADLLEHSARQCELYTWMGDVMGRVSRA